MAFEFGVAEAFQRGERQPDFVIKSFDGVIQLRFHGSSEIPTFFIHLIAVLAQDLSSSPNGVKCAGQRRQARDSAGDIQQRGMGEGGDNRGNPAGGGHTRRHPQPSSGFSEKTLQLFLDFGVRHLLQQGELKPLQHLLALGEKSRHHRPNLFLRFRAKLDVHLVLEILPHRPKVRFQQAQRMLDLGLHFFFDLGFDLILEIFLPSGTGENHLEGLPEGKSFLQDLFTSLPACIVRLFDLPDKSSNLAFGLCFSRVEGAADGG